MQQLMSKVFQRAMLLLTVLLLLRKTSKYLEKYRYHPPVEEKPTKLSKFKQLFTKRSL